MRPALPSAFIWSPAIGAPDTRHWKLRHAELGAALCRPIVPGLSHLHGEPVAAALDHRLEIRFLTRPLESMNDDTNGTSTC